MRRNVTFPADRMILQKEMGKGDTTQICLQVEMEEESGPLLSCLITALAFQKEYTEPGKMNCTAVSKSGNIAQV